MSLPGRPAAARWRGTRAAAAEASGGGVSWCGPSSVQPQSANVLSRPGEMVHILVTLPQGSGKPAVDAPRWLFWFHRIGNPQLSPFSEAYSDLCFKTAALGACVVAHWARPLLAVPASRIGAPGSSAGCSASNPALH